MPGQVVDVERWLSEAFVDEQVGALRMDYVACLIVADGLQPGPSDDHSEALLAAAEGRARAHLEGRVLEDVEHVRQWREAYRAFGAKPKRTRPSVEALLRRMEVGLPRVDRITDTYNAVSIARLLPIGGEDLDAYAGPARLVRADGTETFDTTRDGGPALEHSDPGEVIWRDDLGVTCRRWNWRQCARTRITATTHRAVFILDGLSALGLTGLQAAGEELADSLAKLNPAARLSSRVLTANG